MKKNVYMYITESICCIVEINNIVNQLYFNKINFKKLLHLSVSLYYLSESSKSI